ncbi:mandelate racemase/muconate lactonizing enzyme family protein [Chloroflexi bacterium TSY]|nr:mandelate racemase/muconate lactonizing enzyme family protein [Chloroflexi bacterium TSY]
MGSPVNIAAFVQLDAAIPNFALHESHTSADAFNELVDYPPEREGGYIIVPDRPGIGLDIDESKLAKYPCQPQRITGHFRDDGSVIH